MLYCIGPKFRRFTIANIVSYNYEHEVQKHLILFEFKDHDATMKITTEIIQAYYDTLF